MENVDRSDWKEISTWFSLMSLTQMNDFQCHECAAWGNNNSITQFMSNKLKFFAAATSASFFQSIQFRTSLSSSSFLLFFVTYAAYDDDDVSNSHFNQQVQYLLQIEQWFALLQLPILLAYFTSMLLICTKCRYRYEMSVIVCFFICLLLLLLGTDEIM